MKTLIKSAILLTLVCGGCASGIVIDVPERQGEAIEIVTAFYGITPQDVPPIAWYRQDRLNCVGEYGWGWQEDVGCLTGSFREKNKFYNQVRVQDELIILALPEGMSWGYGALTHELCHVAQLRLTGDSDAEHQTPCFNDPGETGNQDKGLTRQANELLQKAALGQIDPVVTPRADPPECGPTVNVHSSPYCEMRDPTTSHPVTGCLNDDGEQVTGCTHQAMISVGSPATETVLCALACPR